MLLQWVFFVCFFLIWNTNCLPFLVNLIQGHVSSIQEGGKKEEAINWEQRSKGKRGKVGVGVGMSLGW